MTRKFPRPLSDSGLIPKRIAGRKLVGNSIKVIGATGKILNTSSWLSVTAEWSCLISLYSVLQIRLK